MGGWLIPAALAAFALTIILIATISFAMIKGATDKILIGWVFLYPLGYYYLSYPRDRPVIQFDRILTLVLLACILATPRARTWSIPVDMKRVGWAWAIFLGATSLSFLTASNVLTVGRQIVDALLLPAILGWYVLRQFQLSRHAKVLHLAVCVISLYCAGIAIAEVVLHRDLLAFQSNENYLLYDPTDPTGFVFLRPNGPFWSGSSLWIVGLISFFLMAFLWRLIHEYVGWRWRALHITASAAALLQALIGMGRGIFITLLIATVIGAFWSKGRGRVLRLAGIGLLVVLAVAMAVFLPAVFQDRSDPTNLNARVAQNRQNWRIFIDHPVFGVGLTNLTPTATANPRYQTIVAGEPPINYPHNNFAWLAAETGLAGLVPFSVSQILLFVAFRHLSKRGERGRTAWRYFLFIFLSFWFSGMEATTAMYGELNMWFVFAVALLYRYGYGEPITESLLGAPSRMVKQPRYSHAQASSDQAATQCSIVA
jgi:O-antigen ligase